MSFKYNSGRGAVICDICKVIIDEDLSYEEYQRVYENNDTGDLCWRCLGNYYIKTHGDNLVRESKKYKE